MVKINCLNVVSIGGQVVSEPKYHHSDKWNEYYEFLVASKRNSGISDVIPVIATKEIIEKSDIKFGSNVIVRGDYRSYTKPEIQKLNLYVYAKELNMTEEAPCNTIVLEGYICKKGNLRTTPVSDRKIVDVIVATNRSKNKSAYIPCIVWGLDDETANEKLAVGNFLHIDGRVQSREYQKTLENGEKENRIAYEVSVQRFYPCRED